MQLDAHDEAVRVASCMLHQHMHEAECLRKAYRTVHRLRSTPYGQTGDIGSNSDNNHSAWEETKKKKKDP